MPARWLIADNSTYYKALMMTQLINTFMGVGCVESTSSMPKLPLAGLWRNSYTRIAGTSIKPGRISGTWAHPDYIQRCSFLCL